MHDALKRRCLYVWIDYPDFEKELQIVSTRLPQASEALGEQVDGLRAGAPARRSCTRCRAYPRRSTGQRALTALDQQHLDPDVVDETLGLLLKYREDLEAVRGARAGEVLARALARGVRQSG